jgi:hypothetical protein
LPSLAVGGEFRNIRTVFEEGDLLVTSGDIWVTLDSRNTCQLACLCSLLLAAVHGSFLVNSLCAPA